MFFQQFMMGAVFGNHAIFDNGDLVAAHGHGNALRHHDGRLADENPGERLLDFLFRIGVQSGCTVVQNKQFGIREEGAGER